VPVAPTAVAVCTRSGCPCRKLAGGGPGDEGAAVARGGDHARRRPGDDAPTATATLLWVIELFPRSPLVLSPQQYAAPAVTMAQAWDVPAADLGERPPARMATSRPRSRPPASGLGNRVVPQLCPCCSAPSSRPGPRCSAHTRSSAFRRAIGQARPTARRRWSPRTHAAGVVVLLAQLAAGAGRRPAVGQARGAQRTAAGRAARDLVRILPDSTPVVVTATGSCW